MNDKVRNTIDLLKDMELTPEEWLNIQAIYNKSLSQHAYVLMQGLEHIAICETETELHRKQLQGYYRLNGKPVGLLISDLTKAQLVKGLTADANKSLDELLIKLQNIYNIIMSNDDAIVIIERGGSGK